MTLTPARLAVSLAAACALAITLAGCGAPTPAPTPSVAATSAAPSTSAASPSSSPSASPSPSEAADDGAALTAFVDAVQDQIPQLKKTFGKSYESITITADPPVTLVYEYTFANRLDPKLAKAAFNKQVKALQDVCDDQVFPSMKAAGVSHPKARYTYRNPNGTVLWSRTFSEK